MLHFFAYVPRSEMTKLYVQIK